MLQMGHEHAMGKSDMPSTWAPQKASALKERMSLRMRSQVYMLLIVLCTTISANAIVVIFFFTTPAVQCKGAIFRYTNATVVVNGTSTVVGGCSSDNLDMPGIVALVVGVFSLLHLALVLYNFTHAELVLLPGDKPSSCYLRNANAVHTKTAGAMSKATFSVIFAFEMLVAVIPLSPFFYILTLIPAVMGAMSKAQQYFKV